MTVQTTYGKTMRRGVNGEIAWDFGTADITSGNAEAVINFGAAVVKGAAARSLIQGSGASVQGVAVRSILNQYAINASFPGPAVEAYGITETVGVLREGYIWLTNKGGATIVEGAAAYFTAAGLFCDAATVGAVIMPGSRVEKGAAVGDVCLVRINSNIPA